MSLHIQCEKNSMRKSHRFDIPMKIHIQSHVYKTIDWSMVGVSIEAKSSNDFEVNNFYDAVLLLGMLDASISLKVKLKCVYFKNNRYGFEFSEFSQKNKKILRRYLELYIDGKIQDIDDLLAIYEEPDINPVLNLPVKLTDDEKSQLQKAFLRKSIGSIIVSILLLLSIVGILFYNLRYQYEGVGTVEGNYKNVYVKKSGILEKVYVQDGEKVKRNDVLADINSEKLLRQIKLLETIKETKLKKIKSYSSDKNNVAITDDMEILNIKKQIMQEEYKNFQNSKILLKNHLITKAEMLHFKNLYLDAKESYISYKEKSIRYKNSTKGSSIKLYNLEETELKINNKKRELEEYRIFSPYDATVYEITKKTGDLVNKNTPLFVLWIDKVPKIVCYLPVKKAIDIKVGSKVDIIDSLEQQRFSGIVKRIINSDLKTTMYGYGPYNLNEVLVEILPEDNTRILSPKSIVKVLFKRDFKFGI